MPLQTTIPGLEAIALDPETAGLLLELLTVSLGNVCSLQERASEPYTVWRERLAWGVSALREAGAT